METIKWCYCVQGKGNGTLNNELVKAVGKSLMQGVGLNLVLTLSLCKLFPGDKKQGRGTILRANIIPFPPTTHISHSLLILLIYKSPWWRCGGISSCFLPFLLSIISLCIRRPGSLTCCLATSSIPPQQPFPLHHHTSLLHSLPSASLPGRLQIGYFLHALSRALIRGRVLIVGLSLRLTDSSACAAEMPDLVNVCLWCLISPAYINCLDSMCRQSLSILLHCLPPPLCLYISIRSIFWAVYAVVFHADPPFLSVSTLNRCRDQKVAVGSCDCNLGIELALFRMQLGCNFLYFSLPKLGIFQEDVLTQNNFTQKWSVWELLFL